MTFVTFSLNDVLYALDIAHVEEVIPLPEITPVAKLPSFFRGMINLRGAAVCIMDLRTRLGLDAKPDTLETDIIVVKIADTLIGLIVDKVMNVTEIREDQHMSPPDGDAGIETHYIVGVARLGKVFVSIIQLERILKSDGKEDVLNLSCQTSEI